MAIETQFKTKIAILRNKNGCDFVNQSLREILATKAIVYHSYCAYTPQQNGTTARKNVGCTTLVHSGR